MVLLDCKITNIFYSNISIITDLFDCFTEFTKKHQKIQTFFKKMTQYLAQFTK